MKHILTLLPEEVIKERLTEPDACGVLPLVFAIQNAKRNMKVGFHRAEKELYGRLTTELAIWITGTQGQQQPSLTPEEIAEKLHALLETAAQHNADLFARTPSMRTDLAPIIVLGMVRHFSKKPQVQQPMITLLAKSLLDDTTLHRFRRVKGYVQNPKTITELISALLPWLAKDLKKGRLAPLSHYLENEENDENLLEMVTLLMMHGARPHQPDARDVTAFTASMGLEETFPKVWAHLQEPFSALVLKNTQGTLFSEESVSDRLVTAFTTSMESRETFVKVWKRLQEPSSTLALKHTRGTFEEESVADRLKAGLSALYATVMEPSLPTPHKQSLAEAYLRDIAQIQGKAAVAQLVTAFPEEHVKERAFILLRELLYSGDAESMQWLLEHLEKKGEKFFKKEIKTLFSWLCDTREWLQHSDTVSVLFRYWASSTIKIKQTWLMSMLYRIIDATSRRLLHVFFECLTKKGISLYDHQFRDVKRRVELFSAMKQVARRLDFETVKLFFEHCTGMPPASLVHIAQISAFESGHVDRFQEVALGCLKYLTEMGKNLSDCDNNILFTRTLFGNAVKIEAVDVLTTLLTMILDEKHSFYTARQETDNTSERLFSKAFGLSIAHNNPSLAQLICQYAARKEIPLYFAHYEPAAKKREAHELSVFKDILGIYNTSLYQENGHRIFFILETK